MAEKSDVNQEMLDIMKSRETREAAQYLESQKARENAEKIRAEKYARMEAIWAEEARNKARKWARCNHLKGLTGKGFKAPLIKTYMLGLHIFPDNTVRIKCEKCSMKWYKTDTKEFIIRDGAKLPNPTGMGFNEALALYRESDPDGSHRSSAMRFGTVVDTAQDSLK